MKTRINKIKFFPLFNQKWTVADNKLEYQRSKDKRLIYHEVKVLREAIDEYKLEIDPIEVLKKVRKQKIERQKKETMRIEKEIARKKKNEELRNFRRSYSDLMILQQMSRNKLFYLKEIERKTNNINDSTIILTSHLHNSSSMRSFNKNCNLSAVKFPFNINSNSRGKVSRFKVCTQSTNYDNTCGNNSRNHNYNNDNDTYQKNSSITSRNNKTIRKEIESLFQSYTIENLFKRCSPFKPKYNYIKGKVRNENTTQRKLCHSDSNLGRIAGKSKDIESIGQGISWTIYCEKDKKSFIHKAEPEPKKKAEQLRIYFETNEPVRMECSLGTVRETCKQSGFEYAIKKDKKNREYNDYSHLNISVAHKQRKHYKMKL